MASRCCTLLVGGVVSGIYSTTAYLAAFCMEVGWIVEGKDTDLPYPIFVLAIGYFFTLVISIVLLVGLAKKRIRFLLCWLVFVGFFFLPECGLVLYMALKHWELHTPKGHIELTFYIARAVINVLTFVCIQSVFRRMRLEKGSLRRLDFLYSGNSFREGNGTVHHLKAESELSNGHSHHHPHQYHGHHGAYTNPLPIEPELINGGKRLNLNRSSSAVSNSHPAFLNHVEVMPPRHYWNGVKSEFDAASFNQLVGKRSVSEIGVRSHLPTTVFSVEGGWDVPENNNNTSYATHSLERPRHRQNNFGRRSKSLEDVNRASGIPEEVMLEKLEESPFQYLKRPGNAKYDDSDTSDSHSIRDIAL